MVMKNGTIVLTGNDEVKVYNALDGTLLHTFPYSKTSTDASGTVAVNGENLALTDKANTWIYHLECGAGEGGSLCVLWFRCA